MDHIHGAHYVAKCKVLSNPTMTILLNECTIATIFPHGINLGATFNPKLAYETAVVTARETRAANVQWYGI